MLTICSLASSNLSSNFFCCCFIENMRINSNENGNETKRMLILFISLLLVLTTIDASMMIQHRSLSHAYMIGARKSDARHWPSTVLYELVHTAHHVRLNNGTTLDEHVFRRACGGILVSRDTILTAAHCLSPFFYDMDLNLLLSVTNRELISSIHIQFGRGILNKKQRSNAKKIILVSIGFQHKILIFFS